MSAGFLTTENIAAKIEANKVGTVQHFQSWPDANRRNYWEIAGEIEPGMIFWGYCPELKAYFISSEVKHGIRTAILQMEDYRMTRSRTHCEAVTFATSQSHRYRNLLVETLLGFYVASQEALEDCEPSAHKDDISDAVTFLKNCPRH